MIEMQESTKTQEEMRKILKFTEALAAQLWAFDLDATDDFPEFQSLEPTSLQQRIAVESLRSIQFDEKKR